MPGSPIPVPSLSALPQAAANLAERLRKQPKLALLGDMGAGKTTLSAAILKAFGSPDAASSPTFSIVNTYHTPSGPFHHIDLYRLRHLDEALAIGIEDYLYDPHPCIVEWPQLIAPLWPAGGWAIELRVLPDETREIVYLPRF